MSCSAATAAAAGRGRARGAAADGHLHQRLGHTGCAAVRDLVAHLLDGSEDPASRPDDPARGGAGGAHGRDGDPHEGHVVRLGAGWSPLVVLVGLVRSMAGYRAPDRGVARGSALVRRTRRTGPTWVLASRASGRPAVNQIGSGGTEATLTDQAFNAGQVASYLWQFHLPRLSSQFDFPALVGVPVYDVWLKDLAGRFGWAADLAAAGLYIGAGGRRAPIDRHRGGAGHPPAAPMSACALRSWGSIAAPRWSASMWWTTASRCSRARPSCRAATCSRS